MKYVVTTETDDAMVEGGNVLDDGEGDAWTLSLTYTQLKYVPNLRFMRDFDPMVKFCDG